MDNERAMEYNPNRMIDPNRAMEFGGEVDGRMLPDAGVASEMIKGVLDTSADGHGVLRPYFGPSDHDAYISTSQIRRFGLRPGDMIEGPARIPKENERYWGLLKVDKVNGVPTEELKQRVKFSHLTPVFPNEQLVLETSPDVLATRLIDLTAPIGKGQRGMIVSPPKAGKTTTMKEVATGIAANYPNVHLMAVLIGERPEEVTDIRRHIDKITNGKGETAASNFDEPPEDQVRVGELAVERAKRLVELGHDVFILLDSITRLARAYNLAIPTSGRTLS
ncbi:transcription termination factor Rho, partial [Candidatus Cerribacteria bacterium 'Amazon FNV 2010 28 9']